MEEYNIILKERLELVLYIAVMKVTPLLVGQIQGHAFTTKKHMFLHGLVLLPSVDYHVRTINQLYKGI